MCQPLFLLFAGFGNQGFAPLTRWARIEGRDEVGNVAERRVHTKGQIL